MQDYRLNRAFQQTDDIVQSIDILIPVAALLCGAVGQDLLCEHIEVEGYLNVSVTVLSLNETSATGALDKSFEGLFILLL